MPAKGELRSQSDLLESASDISPLHGVRPRWQLKNGIDRQIQSGKSDTTQTVANRSELTLLARSSADLECGRKIKKPTSGWRKVEGPLSHRGSSPAHPSNLSAGRC